ncbi:hypothetical protein GGI43DRAFT_432476 [Trichoderma evansii]
MLSEFHQFGKLPTELRLQVWRHALQPISPTRLKAHFFSVTNYREDGDMLKNLRVQCNLGSDCHIDHGCRFCLAAPKFGSSHSWTSNNPSAYLWDFGMWSACYESRQVIEKHYKIEYWTAKVRQGRTSIFVDHPADTCVPLIHPRTGGDWCFPIHPYQDLVCLQPFNITTVGFYWETEFFMEDFCMIDYNRGLRGFVNLALEYDPSWFNGIRELDALYLFEEISPRGLFIRTLVCMDDEDSVYTPETLWLIDYNLKRDEDKKDRVVPRKNKVFSGCGKKFVQVDLESHDYSDTYSHSALDFAAQLEILFGGIKPAHWCLRHSGTHLGCNECDWGGLDEYYIGHHVQVLACENVE